MPGIEFMPEAPYNKSSRWLTVILITPEEFGAAMEVHKELGCGLIKHTSLIICVMMK